MKIISHRGNINGPNPDKENNPIYIDQAIDAGYDVEIDIRYRDGWFFLGHDTADYPVTMEWLMFRWDKLWIHCKDLESCIALIHTNLRVFCHSQDPYTIISSEQIWIHDLSLNITKQCIVPLITKEQLLQRSNFEPYGICTDYPNEL